MMSQHSNSLLSFTSYMYKVIFHRLKRLLFLGSPRRYGCFHILKIDDEDKVHYRGELNKDKCHCSGPRERQVLKPTPVARVCRVMSTLLALKVCFQLRAVVLDLSVEEGETGVRHHSQ